MVQVSVVIPALNEAAGIELVLGELKTVADESDLDMEVIVVNDGSTDDTGIVAEREDARVIRHFGNRGYGAALKAGIAAASFDYVVIIDADGTYPASAIPALLSALQNADMAVGL